MKSMPLFKVTGANGTTAKQAGAPGTSSSLPRLIKYVCYYNSSFNHLLGSFEEHIHTEYQEPQRPLVLRGHVTSASFKQ